MTTSAKDIMQTEIHTVTRDTPLNNVHRLFLEEEINGAPVVDEDGRLLGVISSLDLLRAVHEEYVAESGRTLPIYFRENLPYSSPDWIRAPEDFQDRMAELTVGDAMIREVVTVTPDTPISEVAATMRRQRIHRVLVVSGEGLVGLISTFDLLQLLIERPTLKIVPHKAKKPPRSASRRA
jgi:CBS domain-containing protein